MVEENIMSNALKALIGKALAVLAFCLMVLIALALPQREQLPEGRIYTPESAPNPQIVLQFDHKEPDGSVIVIPKGLVLLQLVPTKPIAPLPGGSLMICRGETQGVEVSVAQSGIKLGNTHEIGFKCGGDTFVFKAMDIHPEGK